MKHSACVNVDVKTKAICVIQVEGLIGYSNETKNPNMEIALFSRRTKAKEIRHSLSADNVITRRVQSSILAPLNTFAVFELGRLRFTNPDIMMTKTFSAKSKLVFL